MAEENLYFVAIVPPQPIYEEVYQWKKYFAANHQSKKALNSPPHITLHMPFKWKIKKENKLVDQLNQFKSDVDPFEIVLNDFGAFPPRVIYVDMLPSESLKALQKSLARYMKVNLNLFNAVYKDKPFHPHMTIAFRDLKKSEFHQAWEKFEKEKYEGKFLCDRFTLLKHNGQQWAELMDFEF